MNFVEFIKTVESDIFKYLPVSYSNMTTEVSRVSKPGYSYMGLRIYAPSDSSVNVFPILDLNKAYESYVTEQDLRKTLLNIAETYINVISHMPAGINKHMNASDFVDFEKVQNKIVMRLINTNDNKALLSNMPHREFNDLSIIYKIVVSKENEAISTVEITNNMMQQMDVSEDVLYSNAVENTKRIYGFEVQTMFDIMNQYMSSEELYAMDNDMWIFSNKKRMNGAVVMILYKSEFKTFADKQGSNLYILPSSVHELIVIPENRLGNIDMTLSGLKSMVEEVNKEEVSSEDKLSDSVYYYDRVQDNIVRLC